MSPIAQQQTEMVLHILGCDSFVWLPKELPTINKRSEKTDQINQQFTKNVSEKIKTQ